MAKIPWKAKFRLQWERDGRRFYFRALCGVFMFYISRQWEWLPGIHQQHSEIGFGWIPWKIENGGLIPTWTPYRRIYPEIQVWSEVTNG